MKLLFYIWCRLQICVITKFAKEKTVNFLMKHPSFPGNLSRDKNCLPLMSERQLSKKSKIGPVIMITFFLFISLTCCSQQRNVLGHCQPQFGKLSSTETAPCIGEYYQF